MQGLERLGHNFGDWIPGYCVIFCHFSIASSCPICPSVISPLRCTLPRSVLACGNAERDRTNVSESDSENAWYSDDGDLYMLLTDLEAASMGIGILFFGANRVFRAVGVESSWPYPV